MSLQYRWEDRFLNRQDPWILKPQRDHLLNLTEDLQAALNRLSSDPKRAVADLTQRILHPFCYLISGVGGGGPDAEGAAATAERLLGHAVERPGERCVRAEAFYRTRDLRDNLPCVVQECQVTGPGGCGNHPLNLIWKPMTNGQWRLFVFATTAPEALGFKRVLDA